MSGIKSKQYSEKSGKLRQNGSKTRPSDKAKNGASLDTLGQLGTNRVGDDDFKLCSCVDKGDKTALGKRARRKYMSTGIVLKLVRASENNKDSNLGKSYWNSYHCSSVLEYYGDGKVKGKYCKMRWCLVCNAIRTAQLITKYTPILDTWDDKFLVTVTIPNCNGADLKDTIDGMQRNFSKIKEKLKKRNQRKQGVRIVGVRKLECTYNPITNTYHPHYHIVVRGKEVALEVVKSWLKLNPSANIKAQDIREADNNSSFELFKYFTKVITVQKDKGLGKLKRFIYADAMDVIFNAIRGKRTFQNFGFKLPKDLEADEEKEREIAIDVYQWQQNVHDWISMDSGETLSGYKPNEELKELVTKKIIVRSDFSKR